VGSIGSNYNRKRLVRMLPRGTAARDTFLLQSMSEMTRKTVKRADLCNAVYQKTGLSRAESETLVELVLKEITGCLERGETVKLSSFGSFVVRNKRQRIGRNPKTGKEAPILPRRVMVFKPSESLKQRINTGCASLTSGPQEVLATAVPPNSNSPKKPAAQQH
jgi:integration host factor subunit alpha